MENFSKIIKLYNSGVEISKENIGENLILVNKCGFDLIINKNNKEDHGCFLINSNLGHDCYCYNDLSTHIYNVISGNGEFEIDGKTFQVKVGDKITIEPNRIFYYKGKMLMTLDMYPNYTEENDHVVKSVSYDQKAK